MQFGRVFVRAPRWLVGHGRHCLADELFLDGLLPVRHVGVGRRTRSCPAERDSVLHDWSWALSGPWPPATYNESTLRSQRTLKCLSIARQPAASARRDLHPLMVVTHANLRSASLYTCRRSLLQTDNRP